MGCCQSAPVAVPAKAAEPKQQPKQENTSMPNLLGLSKQVSIPIQAPVVQQAPVVPQAPVLQAVEHPVKSEAPKSKKVKQPKSDNHHINAIISKLQEFIVHQLTPENLQKEFLNLTEINIDSLKQLNKSLKHAINLIKNPFGEQEYANWQKEDGGQGWAIEETGCYKGNSKVFVSSFEWCTLSQAINIGKKDIKRLLVVGSPIARRADAESEAKLVLRVKRKGETSEQELQMDCPYGESQQDVCPWELISVKAEIEPNTEYTADVIFSGKDKPYWGGNFGARFGHCFAFLVEL